jgi:hypothetical protein
MLSSRYFDEHAPDFSDRAVKSSHLRDTGEEIPAYTAETVTLNFGEVAATFHEIQVLAKPAGADGERFYGTLGGDALDQLASYTFDFRSMRFLVGEHAEQ